LYITKQGGICYLALYQFQEFTDKWIPNSKLSPFCVVVIADIPNSEGNNVLYLMQIYQTVKGTTTDRSCAAGKIWHTCQLALALLQKYFFSWVNVMLAELLAGDVPDYFFQSVP
jgi:hypothetical protein